MTAEAVGPAHSQADIGSQSKAERSLLGVCGAYVDIDTVAITPTATGILTSATESKPTAGCRRTSNGSGLRLLAGGFHLAARIAGAGPTETHWDQERWMWKNLPSTSRRKKLSRKILGLN